MMRPRISRIEAEFILQCVQEKAQEAALEYAKAEEQARTIQAEIWRLQELIKTNWNWNVQRDARRDLKLKQQELETLTYHGLGSLRNRAWACESVVKKYTVLASGIKHRGRYKYGEVSFLPLLSEMEPKTTTKTIVQT